jgi:hypothetical protein
MTDHISRRDAKELIKKERLDCIYVGAIGAANTCGALIEAIDKLPALDADGRLAGTWVNAVDRLPPFGSAQLCRFVCPNSSTAERVVGACCLTGNDFLSEWRFGHWSVGVSEWLDVSAPPAAERRPAVERPDVPEPMLYAICKWASHTGWFWRGANGWMTNGGLCSANNLEVDRPASDEAALVLYDQDISTSGDAAQPGE